jgi:hypothetical protein
MENDFTTSGRASHFATLAPFLGLSENEGCYDTLRQSLPLEDASARQAVHRFRDRFRRHLREEIAETIASTEESAIDRELEELRRARRGGG